MNIINEDKKNLNNENLNNNQGKNNSLQEEVKDNVISKNSFIANANKGILDIDSLQVVVSPPCELYEPNEAQEKAGNFLLYLNN